MSRHNRLRRIAKARTVAGPTPTAAVPEAVVGPPPRDGIRRLLLLVLTTLLIARTLVGGEDAGGLSDLSDPTGAFLTCFTLLGCAGWAGWLLWSRQPAVAVGWIEVLLFAFVGLLFVACGWVGYRRPAWLIGWEWLGLVLTLFLVRQLAIRADERQGVLAVILALGVTVAADGVYQVTFAQPRLASEITEAGGTSEFVRLTFQRQGRTPSVRETAELADCLEKNRAHGPYFSPDSLAAVLTLALPGLLGLVIATRRGGAAMWQTILVGLVVLLVGAALWLTGNRAALAALAVAGLGLTLILTWPGAAGGWKVGALLALLVGAGLVFGLVQLGLLAETVTRCAEVWPVAWKLVTAHLWLGTGAGQFSLLYPREMAVDGPLASDPSSCLLQLWLEVGLVGPLLLLGGLVLLLRAVVRWTAHAVETVSESDKPEEPVVGWEFHTGGMLGLLLAFVLRASHLPGEDIINEAMAAGVRSLAWFVAFALFESIVWSEDEFVAALCAGLTSWLLLLSVQGGLESPAIMGLGLAVLGLLLAVVEPPSLWLNRLTITRLAPLPLAIGLTLGFLVTVFLPVTNSATAQRRAQQALSRIRTDQNRPAGERVINNPTAFIRQQILAPLVQVSQQDSGNVRLLVQLSEGYRQLYNPAEQSSRTGQTAGELAAQYAALARKTSPASPEGYWATYELHWHVANVLQLLINQAEQEKTPDKQPRLPAEERRKLVQTWQQQRRSQCDFAAQALASYLPYDPTDPLLRFHLAQALRAQGKTREANEQMQEAARLNREVRPSRRLSNPQRERLESWLSPKSPS